MSADQIIAVARECLGTPFQHQGRIPGQALDCAGVLVHVARRLGLHYHDMHGYSRVPSHGRLQAALDMQPCLQPINRSDAHSGDVLLMRFMHEATHIAILTGDDSVIHAFETIGRVVEHRLDDAWRGRVVCAYRLKVSA